ncbi:MAG: glycoside hydrolase family 3 N-terminal domain-containing protein [Flavobacteriaceae bacterium]|nr:glycoside hydrolase family 3 N-terminal domain-containing protein [Flavobacteriaceae bacterium]
MRLDSTFAYPWNMTLGAVQDNSLIEKVGYRIGVHNRRMGVHFNFAPVVDINTNPKNPIIGNRSFGEDREMVTQKALAFMKGMESAGVLSTAKHFPGHGDTDSDSHKTLPTINFNKRRIDSVELYPYRRLIENGVSSVMIAHLNIPALEPRNGYPSSISKRIVTGLLKDSLQFKGLIFTDALNMKGASNFTTPGEIDLAAFKAGNDMLLISEDVPKAIDIMEKAYQSKEITEERLAHSVKKILKAKFKVGLNKQRFTGIHNIYKDLVTIEDKVLKEKIYEEAITVIKNKNEILPLRKLENKKVAYVHLGDDSGSTFYNELKKYTKVHQIQAEKHDELIQKVQNYNTIIVGFHRSNDNPWKPYKFTDKELVWLYELSRLKTVILDAFVRPYALLDIKTFENIEGVVLSYQNSQTSQEKSAQLIFGAIEAKGVLPVTVNPNFKAGHGLRINTIESLSYGLPESVGMSSNKLRKLDSLANYAINNKMTPGIQLLVARKGKVIYHKNFGYHTYEKKEKVKFEDLYDVASLTKILATLPMVMKLIEEDKLSLDSKLGELLEEFEDSNKKDISLKQMLSHYARLKPWIPFYVSTLDSLTNKPDPKFYSKEFSENFSIKVANEMYLRNDYPDTLRKVIKESELLNRLSYRYSDLPYYLLKDIIENEYKKPLDRLVQTHIYEPLGANYTTYNPSSIFSYSQIVPTEEDDYFRYQKVHGFVHDMGAAMQNGVGGHAGIFSNSNDVAKIMQMFLQKGFYGGKRYFKPETIDKFNTCYYCEKDNRRGVGFDKPQLGESGPTCGCISMESFGHSGFTGTYAWADPEEEIVYVFLANRTYPKAGQNLLLRENIRTDIQKYIYEAIIE